MIALWRLPAPGPDNLFIAPAFVRLQEVCQADYANVGRPTFALGNALRTLGLPRGLPRGEARLALPVEDATSRLDQAFRRRQGRRLHLCPLDLADQLPPLAFGLAKLRLFAADELLELVDAAGLKRVFPGMTFDAKRFSQFHWLLVEENVVLDGVPEARAAPFLFMHMGQDLGRIEPHKGRFPPAVEDVLFFTLLAPWEEWAELREVDWRGFRVPWVYTRNDDLFVRPPPPPSPDTLSWEPDFVYNHDGETIEIERPVALPLDDVAGTALTSYDDVAWANVSRALRSSLFETPVAHFFVRAFLTEGIDEVLAHITTIEAALGVQADYNRAARPKPDRHKSLSATRRMAARIAALLGNNAFAKQYEHLFDLRSHFLHGRAMGAISTDERALARRLARQVVGALVEAALRDIARSREEYLDTLLDAGVSLI